MADIARSATKPEARATKSVHEVITSDDFKKLVAKRWGVSGVLLVLLFVVYYGFVIVMGSDPEFFKQRIGEHTTLGIPLAVGVIIAAFVLTAIYVVWANASYDPEVERLKNQLKK